MTTVDATSKRKQAIVQPLLLAGLLAIGAATVLAFAVLWLTVSLARNEPRSSLVVRLDGTPLMVAGNTSRTYYTLDGKEVQLSERFRHREGTSLRASHGNASYRVAWRQRVVFLYDVGNREDEYWYYVHDDKVDGSCYFVDFDATTKQPLGYMGASGFQDHKPREEERIPMDLRVNDAPSRYGMPGEQIPLISGNRLIEVNLRKRTVQTLMTADQMLSHGTQFVPLPGKQPKDPREGTASTPYHVVRLPDRVLLLHVETQTQHSFTLPAEVRDSSFTFYELSPDQALLIRDHRGMGEPHYDLDWIDPAGKIVRHEETESPGPTVMNKPATGPWVFAAALSSPVLNLPLAPLLGADDSRPWPGYFVAYRTGLSNAWLPCTLVVLVAIMLAWLCYRRQRRYAQPWTAAWMVFILLGGLPAWLAFRWHRRWPVLAACPACGQLAPRDRLHCAHCGAEFPVPQAKGIEVFAA